MARNKIHNKSEQRTEAPLTSVRAIPWMMWVVLLLGIAIMGGLYWGRSVTVQNVSFTNNYFVSIEELEQQVDIPLGIRPDSLDYDRIVNSIKKIPYVKGAKVNVEPAGDVIIHITERRPLAMLADGEKKIYVDAEGLRLPLVLGKAVDVPILYGFKAHPLGDTLKSDAFKTVSNFLVQINQNPVYDATISEIAWTETEGVVALTNDNGVKLIFGKGDFETRLRNWKVFYAEVIRQKGMKAMQTIDLRFRGQIVTREH